MAVIRRFAPAVTALAVAAAVLVSTAPVAAGADAAPARAAVFTRGYDTTTRVVTVSMDADWYSPGDVPRVLQILRDNGITAAFGLTGRYVERFPDQARAIVAAGHKLVNHSYDHPYFTQLTRAQRFAELDRAEAAYRAAGLSSDGWFRAPYRDGYADPAVTADLAADGYWIDFDWTFDTTGYLAATEPVILDRVRRLTVPGATVLMHLSADSTDTAALPAVITTLRSMGYGFASPYRMVTTGAIGAHYAALGGERSALGPPRTGEMPGSVAGTAVQWFRTGRVYWRGDLGAHEVHGAIAGRYVAFGAARSFLGMPVTDETSTPDRIGAYNHFATGTGGPASIYWTPSTGAHEVHGEIRRHWAELGWERGLLGYPVGDETAVTGGRASSFRGGILYWSATTGPHEVHGGILARYLQLGGTGGALGLPLSDEYTVPGGRRSDFQHGSLRWDAATGTVTLVAR